MYAFVSNEYRTIVNTQRQLDFLCSVYSYPKFKLVETVAEAKQFLIANEREFYNPSLKLRGKLNDIGYISIQYFIGGNNIYANIYTEHFGFIKFKELPRNVKQDASYDLLKLKICNVVLNDRVIAHHCAAINNILSMFEESINVELILPDISIYLACTKYTGKNYAIQALQDTLHTRAGITFYTIK